LKEIEIDLLTGERLFQTALDNLIGLAAAPGAQGTEVLCPPFFHEWRWDFNRRQRNRCFHDGVHLFSSPLSGRLAFRVSEAITHRILLTSSSGASSLDK
jgi:hypothetical protein